MKTEKTTKSNELTQANSHVLRNSFYKPAKGVVVSKIEKVHGYFYDEEKRSRRFGVVEKKDAYTEIQSHLCECDNEFIKNHLLEHGSDLIPPELFGDCVDIHSDLLDSINRVRSARELFNALPLTIREKYGNDMERFARDFNAEDFKNLVKKPIVKEDNKSIEEDDK